MIKLSNWISDPDFPECYMRIVAGTDPSVIANRVAFIEKTPRVRLRSFTTTDTDFKNWKYGTKGSGDELGSYQPSRDWCDQILLALNYILTV